MARVPANTQMPAEVVFDGLKINYAISQTQIKSHASGHTAGFKK